MFNAALDQAKSLVAGAWDDTSKWRGNLLDAQHLLERELMSVPNDVEVLTGLGTVLCDQAQYVKAAVALERAVAFGSTDANTYYALAVAVFNISGHTESTALFRKAGQLRTSESTWQAYFDPQAQ